MVAYVDNIKNQISHLKYFLIIGNTKEPFSNKFQLFSSFNICRVEYIGENGTWTQFIFNDLIPGNRIYSFKIKIVKTNNR